MNKKQAILALLLACNAPHVLPAHEESPSKALAEHKAPTSRKITCDEMSLLNGQLAANPSGVLRMRMTSKRVQDMLKAIDKHQNSFKGNGSHEKKFVHEQLALIIEPVKEFFEHLQDPRAMKVIKPVIIEGLNKPEKSYIIDFCDSKKDMMTYCDEQITTCEQLKALGTELSTFFTSIMLSLSDDVKQAVKQIANSK